MREAACRTVSDGVCETDWRLWMKEGVQGTCSVSILKVGGQEEALKEWKLSEQTTNPAP